MSRNTPVVDVKSVSKKYCRVLKKSLYYGVKDLCSEVLGRSGDSNRQLRPGEFFALRGISFRIQPGECVALLGPNGAGKSTMMKMLNGLIKPTAGSIAIKGRVGALIELGSGFNPVLSGKENAYINGAILGLSRREIDKRFDEILEFSELGEFIHAPLKTYSSGMRVRLAYSVAAHLEPDLLLLDEVLAVGDMGFRMKCFDHLAKLRDRGTAIIIVSHAIGAMSRIAQRVIVFGKGKKVFDGDVERGMAVYEEQVGLHTTPDKRDENGDSDGIARVAKVTLLNQDGQACDEFQTNDTMTVAMDIDAKEAIENARLVVRLDSPTAGVLSAISSAYQSFDCNIVPGRQRIELVLPELPFLIGAYSFQVELYGEENVDFLHQNLRVGQFKIVGPAKGRPGFGVSGYVKLKHQWRRVELDDAVQP